MVNTNYYKSQFDSIKNSDTKTHIKIQNSKGATNFIDLNAESIPFLIEFLNNELNNIKNLKKVYSLQNNVGAAKYVVKFHNGIKTHTDGSLFFDISIFSNKKKLNLFIKTLKNDGYILS